MGKCVPHKPDNRARSSEPMQRQEKRTGSTKCPLTLTSMLRRSCCAYLHITNTNDNIFNLKDKIIIGKGREERREEWGNKRK